MSLSFLSRRRRQREEQEQRRRLVVVAVVIHSPIPPPQQHDSTTDLSLVGYNKNEDIIMSMTDDRYKSNMYGFYQKLGVSAKEEDEEKMKKEVFDLFQSLNGRFVRYNNWRHPQLGVVELDDKEVKRSEYQRSVSLLPVLDVKFDLTFFILFLLCLLSRNRNRFR